MNRSRRIDQRIEAMLDASGVAWEVVQTSRHLRLEVEGSVVQVFPRSKRSGNNHSLENSRAAVKRHLVKIGRIKR
jgi:hypothetical protein